jgi:hypothetical protein
VTIKALGLRREPLRERRYDRYQIFLDIGIIVGQQAY